MKFKGVKFGMVTKEELYERFYDEYNARLENVITEKSNGILGRVEYLSSTQVTKDKADLKLTMIKEWEDKGIKMDFLDKADNFHNLLMQKHFGKELK